MEEADSPIKSSPKNVIKFQKKNRTTVLPSPFTLNQVPSFFPQSPPLALISLRFGLFLSSIPFSKKKPKLFISLFIDESGGGKKMYDVSYQYFKEVVKEDPTYKDLPADFIEALHDGTWITITGVASLMASGFITPNRQQIVEIIQHSIDGILEINKQK